MHIFQITHLILYFLYTLYILLYIYISLAEILLMLGSRSWLYSGHYIWLLCCETVIFYSYIVGYHSYFTQSQTFANIYIRWFEEFAIGKPNTKSKLCLRYFEETFIIRVKRLTRFFNHSNNIEKIDEINDVERKSSVHAFPRCGDRQNLHKDQNHSMHPKKKLWK